jgi:hypothetical protein
MRVLFYLTVSSILGLTEQLATACGTQVANPCRSILRIKEHVLHIFILYYSYYVHLLFTSISTICPVPVTAALQTVLERVTLVYSPSLSLVNTREYN